MSHNPNDTTRTCTMCGSTYPATDEYFYKLKAGKYGLNAWCKSCHKERNRRNTRKWYAKNKDHVSEYGKQYRASNSDHVRDYNKHYYLENIERERARVKENKVRFKARIRQYRLKYDVENKERLKQAQHEWEAANPEKVLHYKKVAKARRKARKLGNGGTFTAAELRALYDQQQGKCWYCQAELGDTYHADHFIPLSKGGTNDIRNIRLACVGCNLSKNNKMPWEFGRLL